MTRFEDQFASYKNSDYNETQTRRDFIDPFFKALGWDIDNEEGYAEAYREVIHEDKVNVSGATKAPDYSFRLVGGKRLFFVEAKKPSVSVKDDIQPAYQIRRYGWSAKHPISIITDFEEFAIYDCTKKPKPDDKPSVARIKYFTYQDYLTEFDFIWETFSKEQVLKGSFDKFIQSDTHKKGTATVDKDFLESLDRWRTYLAVNISWNNKNLDEDEINFAVQRTIDRIIFLRIAEDRSVEPYGNLKHAIRQGNLYLNLFEQFRKADEKYNSGLFDLKKDRISETLKIENKIIKTIINELYYPECPYEFSVLSVEILGSAYEQFLGKVIRITPTHHAKIEEKPEVRKAGGVYYTPQYIVDYIVKNTVGKLIKGRTPKEISNIKIVDPACGSGSFLIGAYQYLLDWHKNNYTNNGKISKGKKDNPLTPEGHLTTAEKKRILLNNIFGVDLDLNAVEVTKLSLLLKCLEGETEASIQQQFKIWNERVLPTLENNIKDGNSLIGTDFYLSELDFGFEKKIKPFSWENAFPEIFDQGGFNVVIGNPPYVLIEGEFRNDEMLTYFKKNFKSASFKIDLYHLFFERGLQILKNNGSLGFITPSNYLSNNGLLGLRETILEKSNIVTINNISGKVFSGASVDTSISILSKTNSKKTSTFIHSTWNGNSLDEITIKEFDQNNFKENEGKIFISTEKKTKFKRKTYDLEDKYFVKFGMQLRDRKIYKADVINEEEKSLITKYHRPCYTGKDVNKWEMSYSNLLAYFNREARSGGCWDETFHNANPKIIVRQIGLIPICALDERGYCCLNTVFMIVPKTDSEINLKFILGILNSSLIANYWKHNFSDLRQTFPKIKGSYLEKLPIALIDLKDSDENKQHNEIVKLVDQLLKLNDEKSETKLQTKVSQIESKIDYCENRINELVYQLYGLTAEEIKIVEGK
ncbi:MAG: TaqI-like C-terminal specificity domain-containing protein [Bacteroidales bacterium]